MRILMVGALSWNPERVRSLHERGHELWGTWARSMVWDQGPYPMLDDCVRTVSIDDAAGVIAEQEIDCVYGLFQVYPERLWGPPAPGIEHDVWTLLRVLFAARARGEFDVPIVFQWGFDILTFDDDVVRAFDGQIFCNRDQYANWTTPVAAGGAGLDLFDDCAVTEFLDGDRPKQEFMTDDFSPRLSRDSRQVHTVCIGRPFNIDYVAMARNGIHLHVYGNGFDDVLDLVARDLLARGEARHVDLVRAHLHPHESLQPIGRSWSEVQAWKSRWVAEFSRYDAGWSYIGSPFPWRPLEDAAAIPNRLSTYVLVGLPVITDVRPGWYRYEYLAGLGVDVDLVDDDYGALRATLESENASGERRRNAIAARGGQSFDASIDTLLAVFERARAHYFAEAPEQRRRPIPDRTVPVDVAEAPVRRLRRLLSRARAAAIHRTTSARRHRVARRLRA